LGSIHFISKSVEYQINNQDKLCRWLKFVGRYEKVRIEELKFLFVNENEIVDINRKFLKHYFSTDVITFGSNFLDVIKGEIFICISVVFDNSLVYSKGNREIELLRVMVHGFLHLIGYNDSTEKEIITIREKEEFYIKQFFILK